ncbi:MAG: urease accessory protein UreF [Granulosicoccus sp.]
MTDIKAALTLQTWMSAAFPTGAFTCSHGLEAAIADGRLYDAYSCEEWIGGLLQHGSGWNDALFIVAAFSAVKLHLAHVSSSTDLNTDATSTLGVSLNTINDLVLALCAGAERHRETTQLGLAFARAAVPTCTAPVISLIERDITLPVAVGAQGALCGIPIEVLLPASLQATSSNLVWICTRLVPLGQTQALQLISNLQPLIISTAQRARQSSLNDLGSCTLLADLASIEHEQLPSRICIT